MNRDEAKQILLLYRPGTADAEDPQIVAAMELARRDAELGAWFNEQVQFHRFIRGKLRAIEVPPHLKAMLLARSAIIAPQPWWARPVSAIWLGTAAVVCGIILSVALLWPRPGISLQFADFQERMVSEVQRQYVMDWKTSDMTQLRASIAAHGGQADYGVPPGLARLKLTGGGVLKWQSNPVSMLCFDRGEGRMLFLFVMKRDAVKHPPPVRNPELGVVHNFMTASWTSGDNAYVLAGEGEKDLETFARNYLD